ncbi:hypothetical protein L1049_025476 [Liquidambar formosana]|uniref:NmrA-like domain-containing protein n=1 Tax=Liquidambar formosana TaxID=63359 RepID=A0AAP0NBX2_LIQFO
MASEVSKILIFGGTGYFGSYIVKASILMGHPTYIYARPITPKTSPSKIDLHKEFQAMGVTIVQGELSEQEKLVSVLQQVDVVISALAFPQILDQFQIIDAINTAGNIKRFLPSEFGCEEDRVTVLPPFQTLLDKKKKIRRAIEAAGIPYTFVSASGFGAYFVNYLLHPEEQGDDITVYGSGEAKAVLNYEEDIAAYTVKVADDPTACNRMVIIRPPKNIISQLELISLWEKKTGRNFNRVHVPEEELVKLSQTLPCPDNVPVSIIHSLFVKGDFMSFELEEDDIEASSLYPYIKYTTIDELLDIFLSNPPKPARATFE